MMMRFRWFNLYIWVNEIRFVKYLEMDILKIISYIF